MSVAVVVGGLLLSLASVPFASGDDLKDRKKRVEGNISQKVEHLDQSSAKLVAATRALEAAQAKLATAQQHLAETRGQLAVAVVLDRRMQAALDRAVRRLDAAREDLAKGRADFRRQEDVLGTLAVQNYQHGDPNLLGLSMVLSSQNPTDLTSQLNSVRNVLDKESVTLDRLEASRVLLTVKEKQVEKAKAQVARKRAEAAANLEQKKVLEAQAEQQEDVVSDLVSARRNAHTTAADAKRADLEALRGLQQERDRISDILAARAEAARLRAEALEAAGDLGPTRPSNGFLDYPVDGQVTSSYGMRLHPVYKRWALHDGTDFGAACGTPVRAAASGTVLEVYYNTGYGKRVVMDNGYHRGVGLGTAYNHLSEYSAYPGQKVRRGDVIGYVGNTGYSTGCHLHFMVFENGATVNPMGWL
jgi:murein DD-endopeptidase MepM/ murein hydrolase activator NlpD